MERSGSKNVKCPWCDYKAESSARIIDHSRSHTLEKVKKITKDFYYYLFLQFPESWINSKFRIGAFLCNDFSRILVLILRVPSFSALTCGLKAHLQVHLEKKYACAFPSCNFVAKSESAVKTHDFIIHSDKFPFVCSESGCSAAFKTRAKLSRHVKLVHLEEKEARNSPCTFPSCSYRAKAQGYFNAHLKSHLGEKGQNCPFQDCDYACVQLSSLKSHMHTHTKEKPFPCDYEGCDYRATVSSAFLRHKRSVHIHEKKHNCALCPYKGTTKGTLVAHMRSHTKEKPNKCPYCPAPGIFYRKSEGLTQHIISKHPETTDKKKTHECQEPSCSFQTFSKPALVIHSRIHSGEKPFICLVDSCGYRATSKKLLKDHHAARHDPGGRKYKCSHPNCSFMTAREITLKNHEKIVHQIQEKLHKCPLPNCSFATKHLNNLQRHIQINFCQRVKQPKPDFYPCPHDNCSYKATFKANLQRHLRLRACQKHNLQKRQNYACVVSSCRFSTMDLKIIPRHLNDEHK